MGKGWGIGDYREKIAGMDFEIRNVTREDGTEVVRLIPIGEEIPQRKEKARRPAQAIMTLAGRDTGRVPNTKHLFPFSIEDAGHYLAGLVYLKREHGYPIAGAARK